MSCLGCLYLLVTGALVGAVAWPVWRGEPVTTADVFDLLDEWPADDVVRGAMITLLLTLAAAALIAWLLRVLEVRDESPVAPEPPPATETERRPVRAIWGGTAGW